MKKLIIIVACLLSGAAGMKAQEVIVVDPREKLVFGMRTGVNRSDAYAAIGEEFKSDYKYGFVAGFFLCVPISTMLGFQPEVLFSQKGFSATGRLNGDGYDFTRTTEHLDVPLQLQFKPTKFLSFVGGPQYSYLIKTRDVFKNGIITEKQEEQITEDNINKNIVGTVIGADLRVQHVIFSARASWDLQRNNRDDATNTPRYKNEFYQLSIGFVF